MLVFSKNKMLERLDKEGRGAEVGAGTLILMTALDGREVQKSRWDDLVKGETNYYVRYAGENYPVNINDCIEK